MIFLFCIYARVLTNTLLLFNIEHWPFLEIFMFYNIVSPLYSSYDTYVLWFILGIYTICMYFSSTIKKTWATIWHLYVLFYNFTLRPNDDWPWLPSSSPKSTLLRPGRGWHVLNIPWWYYERRTTTYNISTSPKLYNQLSRFGLYREARRRIAQQLKADIG